MSNETNDRPGPRCLACGSPCSVMFENGSGISAMHRWCPVCHGGQRDTYVVTVTATIDAGTTELAKQTVIDALRPVCRLTNVEATKRPTPEMATNGG